MGGPLAGTKDVTITGSNFVEGAIACKFGPYPPQMAKFVSTTEILCDAPVAAGGIVSVSVCNSYHGQTYDPSDYTQSYVEFAYEGSTPAVTGISALQGSVKGGTRITVTGRHF